MHSTYFFFRTFIMPYFQEKVFLFYFQKTMQKEVSTKNLKWVTVTLAVACTL